MKLSVPEGHFHRAGCDDDGGMLRIRRTHARGIRRDLWYCPRCMRYGYHSYYHQMAGTAECFVHGEPLVRSDVFPYAVSTGARDGPYQAYGKRGGAGFGFAELTEMIKGRRALAEEIRNAPEQPEVSFYRINFDRCGDPGDAVWDAAPFLEVGEGEARTGGPELFRSLMGQAAVRDDIRWAKLPDRLLIRAELARIKERHGEDTVRRCMAELDSLGPGKRFLDAVRDMDGDMVREVLLLVMFLGTDAAVELEETHRLHFCIARDRYGLSLHQRFVPELDMRPRNGRGRDAVTGSVPYYVSVLMMRQFMRDVRELLGDSASCCRHMSERGYSLPELFYRVEKEPGTGTIRLYRGKLFP